MFVIMPKFGSTSLNNLKGVHPNMVKLMNAAILDSPVDFTITSGVRTTKEQQALYAQGRTNPGGIVTKADGIKNKSNHQVKADGWGWAVDFVPYINGKVDWNNTKAFKIITDHIKLKANELGIKISCGIDWKFLDMPHVELK